jgi:hypothetical protein
MWRATQQEIDAVPDLTLDLRAVVVAHVRDRRSGV